MEETLILVVAVENGVLRDTGNLLTTIIGNPNCATAKRIAIVAVTGTEPKGWKTFLLDSMVSYLECEGTGNWFGNVWKKRKENIVAGNQISVLPTGIYLLAKPYLVEDSKGETMAIFLMDVVTDADDPQTERWLISSAALLSSTLICTTTVRFEERMLDILNKMLKETCSPLLPKMAKKQQLRIIFDFPPKPESPFGPSEELSEQLSKIAQIGDFYEKVGVWVLPEQELNDGSAAAGKNFIRHFQKLLSSDILDFDDMPHLDTAGVGWTEFLMVLQNFFLTAAAPTVMPGQEVPSPGNQIVDSSSCFPEDVEMLDLSSPRISNSQENTLSYTTGRGRARPLPTSAITRTKVLESEYPSVPQGLDREAARNDDSEVKPNCSPIGSLQMKNEVGNSNPGSFPPGFQGTSFSPKSMSNEERDNLLQAFATGLAANFTEFLAMRENSHHSIELAESCESLRKPFLEKLGIYCVNHGITNVAEQQWLLSMKFDRIYKERVLMDSKRKKVNHLEAESTMTMAASSSATFAHAITVTCPPKAESQPVKPIRDTTVLVQRRIVEIIQKHGAKMEPLVNKYLESPLSHSQLSEAHEGFCKIARGDFIKFCKSTCDMTEGRVLEEQKQALDFALLGEFEKWNKQIKNYQEQLNRIHEKVCSAVKIYKERMDEEFSRISQAKCLYPAKHFDSFHETLVPQIVTAMDAKGDPKFVTYFVQKVKEAFCPIREECREQLSGYVHYASGISRLFDMYVCMSEDKFDESTIKICKEMHPQLTANQPTTTKNDDKFLESAILIAKVINKEVREQETLLQDHTITQVKNFYNDEMKRRLESNVYTSSQLDQIHQELKSDCAGAMTRACNFHEHSGIPNRITFLHQELDKSFTSHSNSNDLKIEKSLGIINRSIRKLKNDYVDSMEQKLSAGGGLSPKGFDSLHEENWKRVAKLLEMELKAIPHENFEGHKGTLKKRVETEAVELKAENGKKLKEKEEEDRRRKSEKLKAEAEIEKKEKERRENEQRLKIEQKREEAERQNAAKAKVKKQREEDEQRKKREESEEVKAAKANGKNQQGQSMTVPYNSGPSNTNQKKTCPSSGKTETAGGGKSPEKFTIGIEFGATRVRAGFIDPNGSFTFVPIPDEWGEDLTRSLSVGFTNTGTFRIGRNLKESDDGLASILDLDCLWNTISKKGDLISTVIGNLRREFIYATILSTVKKRAETVLNNMVSSAVITVPLWYNSKQRQELKNSGLVAGFEDVHLINETSAMAIACALDESRRDSANDLLVVVRNADRIDGAVYSYSNQEVRMIANCVDDPSTWEDKGGVVQSLIRLWAGSAETAIKAVVHRAKESKKAKDGTLQIKEAIGISYDPKKENFHIAQYRNVSTPNPAKAILIGVAHYAKKLDEGPGFSVKDLATRRIDSSEAGSWTVKLRRLFNPGNPIPNSQKISFGPRKSLRVEIFEGPESIGMVDHQFDEEGVAGINFQMGSDGILLKQKTELRWNDIPCTGNNQGSIFLDFEDLKTEDITKMRDQVKSLTCTP